ncbi:MAG: HD domain-containing phosphohydrolase [Bacillota bacterium]|nr:HD domain-containing phosphohydrolase [Bacillota bacterium]
MDSKEWSMMKKHPTKGFEFLKEKFKLPTEAYKGIIMHHERWNDSGYPK